VDTVGTLDDTAAHGVEAAVLPEPDRISDPAPPIASFRRKLRRAGIKADPRTADQRVGRAVDPAGYRRTTR
jgi:hypothetical protein